MSILDEIVIRKKQEIETRKKESPFHNIEKHLSQAPPVKDFFQALNQTGELRIIAEVKKASPSAGILRKDFHPQQIAETYQAAGASAISVLTDEPFFQGKLSYLQDIRKVVNLPLLRKDFILDSYQLVEARLAGADAILLIAEILTANQLQELLTQTHQLGMQALVELYEPENLTPVVDAGARIIGINNRNLRTFKTSLNHTLDLAQQIPSDRILVSESGIRTRQDMLTLQQAGVKAVLIGETFMRAPDMGAKVRELLGRQ